MGEDVPPPETTVVVDGCRFRCELVVYIVKGPGQLKDVRVRGPLRDSRWEALKDCLELRKAAVKSGQDPGLCKVHNRRMELLNIVWTEKDLGSHELDFAEGPARQPNEKISASTRELAAHAQDQQRRASEQRRKADTLASLREPETKRFRAEYEPVGPNWQKPGPLCQVPDVEDAELWLIHERQDPSGKYRPWLFFDVHANRYYQQKDSGSGFLSIGTPHDPLEQALSVRVASASLPSPAGKKLDMAVLLPELHKTGFLLKQPLDFLDRPASLVVLCDALRGTSTAAEFCARRLHTLLLPRLSARATEWEDFELADVLSEAVEALDALLLESPARFSGCSLAVALVVGTRLVLGTLGGTRCILCGPPAVAQKQLAGASRLVAAAAVPWTVQAVVGGREHTASNAEECLRIESAGGALIAGNAQAQLSGHSAGDECLSMVTEERERELLRISRATNVFATLGVSTSDLTEGPAAIRRMFRRRSLAVHPDKAAETLQQRAMAAFAKLEAAAKTIEAALQADAAATKLLMEVLVACDEEWVEADPAVAARLLGVQQGCNRSSAKAALKQRYHAPLGHLQGVCAREVARALRVLDLAVEAAARSTVLWTPPGKDEALAVTRALGCADLKRPTPLLGGSPEARVLALAPGTAGALALLADGARGLAAAEVASRLQWLANRPRAAALRLVLMGAAAGAASGGEAVGAACVCFSGPTVGGGNGGAATETAAVAGRGVRAGTGVGATRPGRVRVSHVLLRWAGLRGAEGSLRPGFALPIRTQLEAERELLELLEELLSKEPKTRGALFKAAVLKRSECPSALNVPHADLGWIESGSAEPALEAAAFDTPVDGISDIAVTSVGAHLLYRMA